MSMMNSAFSCLRHFVHTHAPARVLFIGGKGGVGKTTNAASLALGLASEGKRCLLLSCDPAHSLSDVLSGSGKQEKSSLKHPYVLHHGDFSLDVVELSPNQITDAYLAKIKRNLAEFLSSKLLERMDRQIQLVANAPGTLEAALNEKIAQIISFQEYSIYDHIIFDTAPTGHTLQLLHAPEIFSTWVDGLISSQNRARKLEEVARSLGSDKHYHSNPDSTFLQERESKVEKVLHERRSLLFQMKKILTDSKQCHFYLVMNPENLPFQESLRAFKILHDLNIHVGALLLNRVLPNFSGSEKVSQDDGLSQFYQNQLERQESLISKIQKNFPKKIPKIQLSYRENPIQGVDELLQFFNEG